MDKNNQNKNGRNQARQPSPPTRQPLPTPASTLSSPAKPLTVQLAQLRTVNARLGRENEALRQALYAANDLLCKVERGEPTATSVALLRERFAVYNTLIQNPIFRVDGAGAATIGGDAGGGGGSEKEKSHTEKKATR